MISGFLDIYQAAATLSVNSEWLFQLRVFGLGSDQTGMSGPKSSKTPIIFSLLILGQRPASMWRSAGVA